MFFLSYCINNIFIFFISQFPQKGSTFIILKTERYSKLFSDGKVSDFFSVPTRDLVPTAWKHYNSFFFISNFLDKDCDDKGLELWQYRLWNFQERYTKLERVLAKNQLQSNEIIEFCELV